MAVNIPTTLAAWTAALQALLPPGRAFSREPGSTLAKLLEACGVGLKGGQDTLDALALEADPRLALAMLPEWESLLGLPDDCYEPVKQQLAPGVYDLTEADLLSFTRAGDATCFDEAGLLVTRAANTPRFDHDLSQVVGEEASTNRVLYSEDLTNPGWLLNGAVVTPSATPAADGVRSAVRVGGTGLGNDFLWQIIAFANGAVASVSVDVKNDDAVESKIMLRQGVSNLDVRLNWVGASLSSLVVVNGNAAVFAALGGGWYRVFMDCSVTEILPFVRLYGTTAGIAGCYFDRVQVEARASATSYIKTLGVAVTRAAKYALRGLLVEPQATNLLTYSQAMHTAGAWVDRAATTIVANAALAPDGTMTATGLTRTAVTGSWVDFGWFATVGLGNNIGRFYSFSVWLWAPSGPLNTLLRISDRAFNTYVALVSLDVFPKRFDFTSAGGAGWNALGTQIGGGFDLPLGVQVMAWGAQLEVGASASSYIATAAAQVTRAADVAVVTVPRSLPERRAQAFQRLTEQGGQSRQYFIDMAAALGEPGCTITEFRPMNCNDDCNDALISAADKFSWRVNIPHSNSGARPMNCNDNCNDPLDLGGESVIECPIRERASAHTNVFFAYSA